MDNAVFEIKRNVVGQYYFVFKSDENHNLVVAESFLKRSELEKCISNLREAAVVAEICDENCEVKPPFLQIKETREGYSCSLFGFSGNLIFTSKKYESKEECIRNAIMIKNLSVDAGIVDNAK